MQIRSLFNNWGLKIVSLIVAIFLWLFVTNYQDPETVLTVNNVPVKLLHTEAVKSEGKIYIVLDDSDTIPVVTINAPRSIVDKLEADNVIATADLEDMNPDYTVPITITTNKYSDSISNISGSIRSVSLSVEDEARAIFPIEASVAGSAADGYQMGQVAMDQNQVRVTGPKSEVERVKSAGVIVDISDSDRTVSTNAEIHLYDEDGRDIDIDKNLTLNEHRQSHGQSGSAASQGSADQDRGLRKTRGRLPDDRRDLCGARPGHGRGQKIHAGSSQRDQYPLFGTERDRQDQ